MLGHLAQSGFRVIATSRPEGYQPNLGMQARRKKRREEEREGYSPGEKDVAFETVSFFPGRT